MMIVAAFVGAMISMGICATGIAKGRQYGYACCRRRNDRLYLLSHNGTCREPLRMMRKLLIFITGQEEVFQAQPGIM